MIDSNNINVMREKLRRISGGGSGVQEEIERIDNLIGSSPIPGTQRTITGSLNYLYDNIGGGVKTFEYTGQGGSVTNINIPEDCHMIVSIKGAVEGAEINTSPFSVNALTTTSTYRTSGGGVGSFTLLVDKAENVLSLSGGSDPGSRCDYLNATYTVEYI